MLPEAHTYEALCNAFCWDIPGRFNMGVAVCDRWAQQEPDRIALIDLTGRERRNVSYAELRTLSDALAAHLRKIGVGTGDRVGVFRTQSVWTAAAHIAIWKLGAISLPLFTLFGEDALRSRLENSGTEIVITAPEHAARLEGFTVKAIIPEHAALPKEAFSPVETSAEDPAVLIYTSGTTGHPKGALHAHRVLLGHLPGVEMSHDGGFEPGDVLWTPADWAWIGGLFDVLMPGLYHGVPVVAARMEKFTPEDCLEIIRRGDVRNIFFPPTALRLLKAADVALKGLRTVACGGEPLGAEMLSWGQHSMGITINEFYGQTECNMTISSCAALFPPKPGVTGRVVPGHEVAVIDDQGRPTKSEGDIAVKRGSPVMMLKYWNAAEATAAKFRGDWMLTGDKGIEEQGFIRFLGRDDDVITSSGYRIGPSEIEDCLMTHPSVANVGVVGKPDTVRTEIVKAYVVLKPGTKASQTLKSVLQKHVADKLAAYEYPREISFVETLPMTITGKIIRKELRARATAEAQQKREIKA